jgi:hypothetical protein
MWGRGIAPRILNRCISFEWRGWLYARGEFLASLLGTEPLFLDRAAHGLVTIPTELSRSIACWSRSASPGYVSVK